jgi:hypothetical protein
MLHDNSLFSKVGSATITALARAVNTLLTPTTMGGEKFHITVTIDNEKALQIADFLHFRASEILLPWNKIHDHEFGLKSNTRLIPGRRSGLQFFCHVQPLKLLTSSDFYPPTYVSTLSRCRLRIDSDDRSGCGCRHI